MTLHCSQTIFRNVQLKCYFSKSWIQDSAQRKTLRLPFNWPRNKKKAKKKMKKKSVEKRFKKRKKKGSGGYG